MIQTFIYSMAGTAALVAIAVIMWRVMLEGMDKRNGANFRTEIYPRIRQSNLGLAFYHSARLLAIAIIVAAVIGRFV